MKKGFTLIELLAVIVILAIILVIAVPQILGVIRNSTIGAMESDAKLVLNAISQRKVLDIEFDPTQYNDNLNGLLALLGISGDNYTSVTFSYNEGVLFITVNGKEKYEGLVACGTYHDMRVADNECAYYIDITAPVITLNGSSDIELDQGTAYTELGATAIDDKDGNVSVTITGTVDINTIGTYTITYTSEDKSGNVATLIRTINVVVPDITAPVITLNGSSNIQIDQGISYTELGATAIDDKDGIVLVTITGTVDINIVGTYTITYTSKDKKGNTSTLTRSVIVIRPYYNISKGVNRPVLTTGMTPIKWNGSSWINTTEDDTDWYNYTTTDKKWANAKTTDGSMWVWIPRYIYNISYRWHTSAAGTINIQFSKGIDDTKGGTVTLDTGTTSNASNNKWTNHPAFTFGNKEVTGIWIAKFQASNSGGNIKITPGVGSWVSQTIGTIFTKVRGMETNSIYGWGTSGIDIDTHLMKNVEWGSAAYLAISTYGKNIEVSTNTSASTGGGSGTTYASNVALSTTGNIYGIYDMTGIYYEYTAAYINNGTGLLTSEGNSLYTADNKYKDIYSPGSPDTNSGNFPPTVNKKGDAIYETCYSVASNSNAWYSDHSEMPSGTYPFMLRGGYRSLSTSYSGMFAFGYNSSTGYATNYVSFRPVIMIDTGL